MHSIIARITKLPILALITVYRYVISPVTGQNCRFYPSCSVYAYQAVNELGLLKGGKLAVLRILRCRPGIAGGYDPVPCCNIDHLPHTNNSDKSTKKTIPESAR